MILLNSAIKTVLFENSDNCMREKSGSSCNTNFRSDQEGGIQAYTQAIKSIDLNWNILGRELQNSGS